MHKEAELARDLTFFRVVQAWLCMAAQHLVTIVFLSLCRFVLPTFPWWYPGMVLSRSKLRVACLPGTAACAR